MPPTAYLKALWPAVSSCLVMAAAVLLVRAKLPVTTLAIRLAAEVLAGAALYASCIALFHRARITGFIAVIKGARA